MVALLASCGAKDVTDGVSSVTDSVTTAVEDVADTSIGGTVEETVELGKGFADYDEALIGAEENTVLFFHQESWNL